LKICKLVSKIFYYNKIKDFVGMTFDKVSNQILKETMEKSLVIDWLKSLKNFG